MFAALGFHLIHNVLGLVLLAAGLFLAFYCPAKLGAKALIAYYIVRYALIVGSFAWMPGMGSADLDGWYMHAQWMVDGGLFPGKDFNSPYHLGFNAGLWAVVRLWHSPYAIVLLWTLVEYLAVVILYRALSPVFGAGLIKQSLILFLFSPICYAAALSTQDEPLILFGVAVSLVLIRTTGPCWMSVIYFLAIFVTKIFAPFFLFPVCLLQKWRGVFALALGVLAYWALAYLIGVNPFDLQFGRELGLSGEADQIMTISTVGNVWQPFHVAPGIGVKLAAVSAIGLVGAMFSGGVKLAVFDLEDRYDTMILLMSVLMLAFVAFYPMTFFMYVLPALPFMYLAILKRMQGLTRCGILSVMIVWQLLLRYTFKVSSFWLNHLTLYYVGYFSCLILLFVAFAVLSRNVFKKTLVEVFGCSAVCRDVSAG